MRQAQYDLVSMGRSSIDLYSNDSGAPFAEISNFAAFVGGCPTNIAVGACRLGLRTLLLTATGDDPVSDFVLKFLRAEKVETAYIPCKPGFRTSAVILGIEPPDKYPLVFYRENCADLQINIDDVTATPIEQAKILLVSGTGFSREPSRSATIFAIEQAHRQGVKVILDLDFRADQWLTNSGDVRHYGVTIRSLLPRIDIVLGTQEEVKAATLTDKSQVKVAHSQVSSPEVEGNEREAIASILSCGPQQLIVKRGADGASVHFPNGESVTSKPFKVEVVNVLGAGDAFAAGLIYGIVKGWSWEKCLRMGNAIGAIVVTRQGCANFMPFESEALEFVAANGGFAKEGVAGPC